MKNTLNSGQTTAVEQIRDFLDCDTGGEHYVLSGGPGTGKTYLTKFAISKYKHYNRVAGVTISHAAKIILENHMGSNVNCYTVASLLGMRQSFTSDGKMVFKESPNIPKIIQSQDAIILDEISMIDDPLYEKLMIQARNNNVKIIAIGDRYQLPPVEQDHDSKFFNNINISLTEQMRFTGPIGDLAETYRQQIQNLNEDQIFDKWILNSATNRQNRHDKTINSGYKFINKVEEVVEMAADSIAVNKTNVNHSRILAFKNDSVYTLNTGIRNLIFGNGLSEFEPDEILIANNNYYGYDTKPVIYNGQILRVHSYVEDNGPHGIPCARIKFKNLANPLDIPIYVLLKTNPESIKLYNKKLEKLKAAAQADPAEWPIYSNFVNQFAYFDYAYAVNLYRAQGATLENAYVFEGEVMAVRPLTWKQKFQALYVAMTRPSKNLVIYNNSF